VSLIGRRSQVVTDARRCPDAAQPPLGTDEVHVYNVLWGIPESMGGMTTAALRRIRSFQTYGRPLSQTVLTFSPRMNTDEIRARLVSQGKMRDDVELVNIWQDLRSRTESELEALSGEPLRAPAPEEDGEVENITAFYDVFRSSRTGTVIRRNYRRADGSLLLTDVRDPKLGTRFVLHSPSGTPMTEWRRPRDFYNAWISAFVTKEPAVVIVDDKKVSEFIHEISDRHFGLILFLHGSHLRHPWNGNHGQVLPRRVETMRNFDRFDIVGVQTEQQAEAIRAMGFSGDNIRLLTGELPAGSVASEPRMQRAMEKAVMVANLIDLKRIEHPIRAVAKLRDRGVDVTLTVLGEGPARPKLERLINALDVGDRVELPGYVDDVPDRLKSASFSMLTSASEGLPLSVMEAMGAGCIPIVYDITYGPRDLIEQGKNGYITPRGDIGALADQIEGFLSLNSETVDAMRRSAMKTVERYLPEVGYERWKTVLEELRPAKQHDDRNEEPVQPVDAKKIKCEPISRGTRIEIELDQVDPSIAETLELVFAARSRNTFFICRNHRMVNRRLSRRIALYFNVDDEKFSESSKETFDVYLRRPHDLWSSKRRLRAPNRYRPEEVEERQWYSTKHGNLSVRPRP
jgi:poly(glycerol-phosphate) alpha-glucosyltransferase